MPYAPPDFLRTVWHLKFKPRPPFDQIVLFSSFCLFLERKTNWVLFPRLSPTLSGILGRAFFFFFSFFIFAGTMNHVTTRDRTRVHALSCNRHALRCTLYFQCRTTARPYRSYMMHAAFAVNVRKEKKWDFRLCMKSAQTVGPRCVRWGSLVRYFANAAMNSRTRSVRFMRLSN